jgi:predicted ATPase/DNA-binding SARP family transcriptional activator
VPLTRFIGRDSELAELTRILETCRLLTLTGAGGSGKTRLVSEVINRKPESIGPVVWADLAAIHDPTRIVPLLTSLMGLADRPEVAPLDALSAALEDRHAVLVLDNCEHLVDACAGISEALLRQSSRLVIVATSREALGVPGETAWLVPPMRPDEAMQLFVERAQSVSPAFQYALHSDAITSICRRLDGIPLAIELAAARVRVLSPTQIADRLSDAFRILGNGGRTALPRHKTLRAAIDWSYALLSAPEQLLLQRLSVFDGSFSLDAVEGICQGDPLLETDLLDGLSGLVDKSLVAMENDHAEARYRLLETVRQYSAALLNVAGYTERIRERHALWYLEMVEAAAPALFGGGSDLELLARITIESDNLRAAADWAAANSARTAYALRMGYGLHWYWFAQGQFEEGRARLTHAVSVVNDGDPVLKGRALIALGHINLWQGRVGDVLPCMEASLELLAESRDKINLAYALNGVGAAHYLTGNLPAAMEKLDAAYALAGDFPDHVLYAIIQYWRGRASLDAGEMEQAHSAFQAAADTGRRIKNRASIGHPTLMLGRLSLTEQQPQRALAYFIEALSVLHETKDLWGIAQGLEGVGCVMATRRHAEPAAQLIGAAAAIRERIATPLIPGEQAIIERCIERLPTTETATWDAAWLAGRAMSVDDAVAAAQLQQVTAVSVPAVTISNAAPASLTAAQLEVKSLGGLVVRAEGTELAAAQWGSPRSRELLVFLLCHPEGCTKEQVGLAFWPEASAAQVRNGFHVTLHRLRRALMHPEWITVANDRYQFNRQVVVNFDARRLESELPAALRLGQRREATALTKLDELVALYEGDFLAGESAGDWHLTVHDRLQRLYIEALLATSALRLETGDLTTVIADCRRLLVADNLHEEAWRRLMIAHARLGERTQALRLFHEFEGLLDRELAVTPDRTTHQLFQQLQAGQAI